MTSTQSRNRPVPFGLNKTSSSNTSNKAFGSGFSATSGAWNDGIWSNTAIGSGLKNGRSESGRMPNELSVNSEVMTGSGSLLPSSESDGFNHRHGSWKSIDDTSPGLSRVQSNTSNTLVPQPFNDPIQTSSYFSVTPASGSISSKPSKKNLLDPTTGSFVTSSAFDSNGFGPYSRHNSNEDDRYTARKLAFEGSDHGTNMPASRPSYNNPISGYDSRTASRSGSLPPTRPEIDQTSRHAETQPAQYARLNPSAATNIANRPNLSAQAQPYIMAAGASGSKRGEPTSSSQIDQLLGDHGKLGIRRDNLDARGTPRDLPYMPSSNHVNGSSQHQLTSTNEFWNRDEQDFRTPNGQLSPSGSGTGSMTSNPNTYRGLPPAAQYSYPSSNSDGRFSHNSPYYPIAGTPTFQPRSVSRGSYNGNTPAGQAAMLDRKLRGVQQERQGYMIPQATYIPFQSHFPQTTSYDFHPQSSIRMNMYPQMPPQNFMSVPQIPRGPARDHDAAQRSALLEEFRNNSKTNKRYELKDIHNHIVEFSGDQHGSRFIQQKLETANSDEKDQVFRELSTNAIQLMTDVFGNYVIQKFFEHGNQAQKKALANQMRNHVLTLSTQMYGCRVVQKALEHILTDQQAQLVKELEHNVLKCVKDQNGNHVVQKAIERLPEQHIQFIINSFTGQVQSLATHPYGCRVIQRMLEHCEEPTQIAILQELHACAPSLIVDQYGNYVTQHVIEHGKDVDRGRLIDVVRAQLIAFSKHKFASNVVEKSIEFGSQEERQELVAILTAVNDKGESPAHALIRDQYGNYVIQKLLNQLKGVERDDFVELIKAQLVLLKRFSYGKQIAAIEKLICTNQILPPQIQTGATLLSNIDTSAVPTPALSTGAAQSPQSASLPSPHVSSVDDPPGSRKSSGSNVVGVMTPTST